MATSTHAHNLAIDLRSCGHAIFCCRAYPACEGQPFIQQRSTTPHHRECYGVVDRGVSWVKAKWGKYGGRLMGVCRILKVSSRVQFRWGSFLNWTIVCLLWFFRCVGGVDWWWLIVLISACVVGTCVVNNRMKSRKDLDLFAGERLIGLNLFEGNYNNISCRILKIIQARVEAR